MSWESCVKLCSASFLMTLPLVLPAPALAAAPGFDTPVLATASVAPAANGLSVKSTARAAAQQPVGAVRMITVVGANHLSQREIDQVTAAYLGHVLSEEDKRDLLAALSGMVRGKGYMFARSSIASGADAQGRLKVVVSEGRIDEVRLSGGQDPAVQSMLNRLVGSAPNRADIERQVLLAQDLPGVEIGKLSYERDGDRGVLIVPFKRKGNSGRIAVDNWGTQDAGPARVQLAYDIEGVVGHRDRLSLAVVVTPADPSELGYGSARYGYQIGSDGTEVAVSGSYGRTQAGGFWRQFDTNGTTFSAGVSVAHPLVRGRKSSLWLNAGLDYLALTQNFAGFNVRRDRLAIASVSLNGFWPVAGGRLRLGAGVNQGLGLAGTTLAGDPLASRPDASGRFTRFNMWGNWVGDLYGPFSARLAFSAQTTTSPLLAMQQIALGGPSFGRAYDFSEKTGDRGVLGSAELQANLVERDKGLLRSAQLYSYADAGVVENLTNTLGTGSLSSAGMGTRLGFAQRFLLSMEAAFPLNQPRYQTGDKTPRLTASLIKAF